MFFRLAGVLQVLEEGFQSLEAANDEGLPLCVLPQEITKQNVQRAIALVEYFQDVRHVFEKVLCSEPLCKIPDPL